MPVFQLFLLLLWAALLFGGYFLGGGADRRMPRWTRLGSSLVLVVAGWTVTLVAPSGPLGRFALLIAIGMTLGFVGDLFMARVIPLPNRFFGGIAGFALGHVAYIAAGLGLGNALNVDPMLRLAAWLAWLLIGALAWWAIVYRDQQRTALHWATLPYSLLLASTTGVATGLALQQLVFLPFAVGAALFLFSDLLIAAQLFAVRFLRERAFARHIDDVIWLTYGPGQMLIVHTVPIALLLGASLT
jgi:hypothetical protein